MLAIPDILIYLFVIITAIAALVSVELMICFKRPFFLKMMLQLVIISILFNAISVIYQLKVGYNRWLFELPTVVFGAAGFNFFAYIFNQKCKKWYITFGALIISLQLLVLLYFSFIHRINVHTNLLDHPNYSLPKRIIRLFFASVIIGISIDIFIKILKKYNSENIYFKQVRNWSIYALISISICFLSNLVLLFHLQYLHISLIMKGFAHLTCLLFVLFRPKFLNNTQIQITLSESFNLKSIEEISTNHFLKAFFTNCYYLNKDASIDSLSNQLQITSEQLKLFVEEKYQSSFIDLLNKQRVNYFVDLVSTGKFQNYTLDALAQMSGFNTRHNLTRSFKKYHGGTPSQLMKAVTSIGE